MDPTGKPRVLFVYYSYTSQTSILAENASAVFRDRGCEVESVAIEFTDQRYAGRFSEFPSRHPVVNIFAMLPAQLRRVTGEIRIPEAARRGDYDLVCICSPTWWLTTNMPVRSFLKSADARSVMQGKKFATFVVCRRYWKNNLKTLRKLGEEQGGDYVDGIHFTYLGGQVRSMMSFLSYSCTGEYRDRFLGVKIPPTNLQPDQIVEARAFAGKLADRLTP